MFKLIRPLKVVAVLPWASWVKRSLPMSLVALFLLSSSATQARTLQGAISLGSGRGKIGVCVDYGGKVYRVHPHSPAQRAGIQAGDKILAVDGRKGSVSRIHGPVGTDVELLVMRGEQELHFSVERVEEHAIAPYSTQDETGASGPGTGVN